MKLVWHATQLKEVDWFRYLLGDLIDEEVTDLDLKCLDDDTIHVLSGNWTPLPTCEAYFRECRERCKRLVLIHIADEWFSGSYALYRHFDTVLRIYHTYLADCSGILTIPLGYTNQTRHDVTMADARHHVWSFAGEIKASRIAMVAAFESMKPAFMSPGGLTKTEYDAILADSTFSPCPMGNAILETWRLYESLELGCIPLVERRRGIDYFDDLFGPNPLPTFRTWPEARHYAETLYTDKRSLVRLQTDIRDWWGSHKAKVREQVREIVSGPSHSKQLQQYGGLIRNRFSAIHEPLRLVELLRHQSSDSLRRRLMRPSGPLKRIVGDLGLSRR